mgnify:CR=1 FL=1
MIYGLCCPFCNEAVRRYPQRLGDKTPVYEENKIPQNYHCHICDLKWYVDKTCHVVRVDR